MRMNQMDFLKKELDKVLNIIPKHSKIIFADYPVYGNIGDLLIMKGTEEFFKANHINVIKKFNRHNFPYKNNIPKDIIIVCQGGGNFGDLYTTHQKNREKLIKYYPNNKIVILPQTIYYRNTLELEKTKTIFNNHSDLHVLTRDENSYEIAKENFSARSYLIPDMAHYLWPLNKNESIKNILNFIRTDKESNNIQNEYLYKGDTKDWGDILTKQDKILIRTFISLSKVDKLMKNMLPISYFWDKFSDHLVTKCTKVFSEYKYINTSRLHGHILSCLIGRQNTVIDNSYGKNSSYYNKWTSRVENSSLVK